MIYVASVLAFTSGFCAVMAFYPDNSSFKKSNNIWAILHKATNGKSYSVLRFEREK